MRKTITAFAATITGKLVLGTAIAAAGVGGAVAADVELPSQSQRPTLVETAGTPELPEQAQHGQQGQQGQDEEGPGIQGHEGDNEAFGSDTAAEQRPDFVNEYLDSVAAWLECVHAATELPDDGLHVRDCDRLSGPENPGEGVGEGPPTEAPGQGGDNANPNAAQGQDRADAGPADAGAADAGAADAGADNADDTPAPAEQGGSATAHERRPAQAGAAGNRP